MARRSVTCSRTGKKCYGAAAASRRTQLRWLKKARARRRYLSTCRRRLGVAKARTLAPVRLSAPALIPESHRLPAPAPMGAGPFGGAMPRANPWYQGWTGKEHEIFHSRHKPTEASHGRRYKFATGPFKLEDQAYYGAVHAYGTPVVRVGRHRFRGVGPNPGGYLTSLSEAHRPSEAGLMSQIRAGDRVTFADHFGQLRVGRAVMPSAHGGWVLNMGGPHGTPAVVDERNVVRVKKAREVTRNPELLVVNNPGRRGGYELHYGSGGHGGPYPSIKKAKKRARALLKGSPTERAVYIRRGVSGPLVDVIKKYPEWRNPRRSTNMRKRRRRRNYWKGNRAGHRRAALKGLRRRRARGGKRRKYSKRRKGRKGRKGRRRGGKVFKGAIKYRGRWYRRKALRNKIGKRRLLKILKKRGRRNN